MCITVLDRTHWYEIIYLGEERHQFVQRRSRCTILPRADWKLSVSFLLFQTFRDIMENLVDEETKLSFKLNRLLTEYDLGQMFDVSEFESAI